jgi:small subunit ribosomal protein S21
VALRQKCRNRFAFPPKFPYSEVRMIKVRARRNEPLEQLLKRFKKACEKEGLIREMRRTAYYEKPSDARRRENRQKVRRRQKLLRGKVPGRGRSHR